MAIATPASTRARAGARSAMPRKKGVPGSIMVPKPFVDAQILTALATLMNTAESVAYAPQG